MSNSSSARRAVAEVRSGENQMAGASLGSRSIHQFWYLYSPYFRNVLLPPHRSPESDRVTWSWQEASTVKPVTAPELAEVRRRLAVGLVGMGSTDEGGGGGALSLDAQVRKNVTEMVTQLSAQSDSALAGYACRTPSGLMLHSWSALSPATPYFPDARQGEVSGTVFVGGQPTAGVTVVIQNKSGGELNRVTSDRAGAFSFANISAGQYRVRVTDRADFSADGLAVTVEKEPVGGLQLRGGSEHQAALGGTSAGSSPLRHQRRWLAGLLALLLVGAGGFIVWRYTQRPATREVSAGKAQYGWQSASGKLAAPGEPAPTVDARKVGNDGSWSQLSRTVAAPKALQTPSHLAMKENQSSDRAPGSAEDLPLSEVRAAEEKSPAKETPDQYRPARPEAAASHQSPDRTPPVKADPPNAATTPEEAKANDESEKPEAMSREKSAAKEPRSQPGKKPRPVAGSSLSAVENPSPEIAASGGEQPARTESASVNAPAAGSKSAAPKPVGGSRGTGTAKETATAEVAAESGTQDEAAADRGVVPTDHLKARLGAKPAERAGVANSKMTAAPADSKAASADAKSEDESAAPETASAKNAPAASRANNPAARPTATPSPLTKKPSSEDRQGDEAETVSDAPAVAKGKPKQAVAATAGKAADTEPAPQALPGTVAQQENIPTEKPESAPSAPEAKRATRPKNQADNRSMDAAEKTAGESAVDDPDPVPAPSTKATDNAVKMESLGQISTSAWHVRMVRDVLLPTQPVPEGEDDALAAIHQKLLREQNAQMPSTFRQPVTWSGFAFELLSDGIGSGGLLRWRDAAGAEIAGATVSGRRAEVSWAGAMPPRNQEFVLSDTAGREIARVSFDQAGLSSVKTRPELRGWYWVGVERAPAEAARGATTRTEPRLDWQLLSGATVPANWPRDDHWRGGNGQRIDLPLGLGASYTLALVDRVTGWAITCDIALR